MGDVRLSGLIRRIADTLCQRGEGDGELLERFVARRDEAAFEALVLRHGPMVLGVCRRVLGHEQDAEDAFQATFLVLAREAARVRQPDQLRSWLHGVAHRTARHASRTAARRRAREALAVPRHQETDKVSDLRDVLHDELAGLPPTYREVIVLCDLEGKARREVAGLLGCPEGTVASRLARAREALARRLHKHGLAIPAVLAAATAQGAAAFAAGREVAGAVPARVVALAAEVGGAMLSSRLTKAALLLLVALLAAGVGALSAGNASRHGETTTTKETRATAPVPPDGKAAKADEELRKLQGTWVMPSEGRIWVIEGEKLTYSQGGPGAEGKFKIDPAKRPKTIDVSFPSGRADSIQGTYEVEGNSLKVSYSPPRGPGAVVGPGMPGMGAPGAGGPRGPGMPGMPVGPGGMGMPGPPQPIVWVFKRYGGATTIAADVGETYERNAARGDEKFTDRQVTVTGRVVSIKRYVGSDSYALMIRGSRNDTPLVFYFEKDARKQLAKLEPGQMVSVQGECLGKQFSPDKKQEVIAFAKAKILTMPE